MEDGGRHGDEAGGRCALLLNSGYKLGFEMTSYVFPFLLIYLGRMD